MLVLGPQPIDLFPSGGQIRVARLSSLKTLAQGSASSLQQVWNILSQNGTFDVGVDARMLQFFAAPAPAESASVDRMPDWIAVSVPSGSATVATDPPLLEGAAGRFFTLQTGIAPPTVSTGTRNVVVAPDFQIKPPTTGLSGGWAETFLLMDTHPLLPVFEFDDSTVAGLSDAAPLWSALNPPVDTLVLSGDFSAGYALSWLGTDVGQMVVVAGNDYSLASEDGFLGAGRSLTFDARSLGAGNHAMFDGSGETDGRFSFFGSGGNDFFFGGGGGDSFRGLGGADTLSGGGGADLFLYSAAAESSGAQYDTLADFDPDSDRIDLPGAVASFDPAIAHGALSTASFNTDLAAVLGGLGAGQAVWYAPDSGDLSGKVFLVVDGNGTAGYQAGEDYVFAVGGALADLAGHTGFFV